MKYNKTTSREETDAKGVLNSQRGVQDEESSCVSGPSRRPHRSMLVTLTLLITPWNLKKGTSEWDKARAPRNHTETFLLQSWTQHHGNNSITPPCRLVGGYISKDTSSATLQIPVTLILILPRVVDYWHIDQMLPNFYTCWSHPGWWELCC